MKNDVQKSIPASSRPLLACIPDPTCPILLEARGVLDKVHLLHRAIHTLRLSTQRCLTCPQRLVCPTVSSLAHALDTAIREFCQEWGFDHE